MGLFRLLGLVLFVAAIGWLLITLYLPVGRHPLPVPVGFDHAINDTLKLPIQVVDNEFKAANQRMLKVSQIGTRFRLLGDVASWLSFFATAAITIIAGFYGRMPVSTTELIEKDGLPPSTVRLIAVLASFAAVLTGLSSLAVAHSQDYFKRADEYHSIISQTRSNIKSSTSADDQQALLDDLVFLTPE